MPPRTTTPEYIQAARNRPKRPRPERRHPEYEQRLALIAQRTAEGVPLRTIAKELGLCWQRVQALKQLLPSSSRSEKKTP